MSEIRRKLVIVGDGACGKVCLFVIHSMRNSSWRFLIEYRHVCWLSFRKERSQRWVSLASVHTFAATVACGQLFRSLYIILNHDRFLGLRAHRVWELCRRRWGWRQARWTRSMGYSRTGRLRSSPAPQLSRLSRDPHLFRSRLSRLAW